MSCQCNWGAACGMKFTTSCDLYTHVSQQHVGEKVLECQWEICKYTAVKKRHLESHIMVHINYFPHKCNVEGCDKSFKRKYDLRKHILAIHSSYIVQDRTKRKSSRLQDKQPISKAKLSFILNSDE